MILTMLKKKEEKKEKVWVYTMGYNSSIKK